MKRFLFPLAVFFILLIFLGVGLRLKPQEIPSPFIGKAAPAFNLTLLEDEQKLVTPELLKGKVWILNVWASWCTSCRAEHPVLLEFAKQGVVPLVGLDYMDKREDAIKWLEKFGNPYQLTVFDPKGRTGTDYGVYGIPESFVIDKQGMIRMKHVGPVTQDALKEKLLPLIEKLQRE